MAGKGKSVLADVGSSLLKGPVGDRLKQEAREFATARGSDFVQSLGGRLEGVTQRLEDHAENPNGRKNKNGGGDEEGQEDGDDSQPGRLASLGSGLKDKAKSLVGKGDDDGEDGEDGEEGEGGEGGDGEKKGRGKGRSGPKMTNIIEDINVGVPVSVAYDQWTQFQEFGSFMKGIRGVDAKDEVESNWRGKVWWSTRSWSARVTEQIPDRKIAWTTDGAKGTTKGTVTFHPLADDLTKILVVVEYYPKGFMEKTANLWRAFGRRVRLDLKHFRRFVTTQGEASGSWRGEIRDGEVVREPDENDDYRREDDFRPPNKLHSDDSEDSDFDDETEDDEFDDEFDDEDDDFDDEDEGSEEDDEPTDEFDEDGEPSDESEDADQGDDEGAPEDAADSDEPTDESEDSSDASDDISDERAAESEQGDEPSDESENDADEPAERPARRRRPSSREGARKRPRRRPDSESGDGSDESAAESDQGGDQSDESGDNADEPAERPARRRRPSSREGSRQRSERSSDGERNGRSSEGRRSPRRARKSTTSA
ncbi:SRPBCC family protein [Actinopolymorpha singaporensis]|uniref:Polyketide cyclase / dehydrase and lipid transport n=1 Tax=Actinopolymorpha singaporensis TaxID=117157 RepID=A0A1H1V561_9ACTN|nr:SRPBCC family protein [Actinopolymorpha singaporensis]SDS79852.1 Polyketide cyclase / dehydrase and lipid transport [Actinopolymorpha singaporensis]